MDNSVETSEAQPKDREPVGEVIIGNVNPATLTQEEFNQSPDLLYHGAKDVFNFSRDFDLVKGGNDFTIGLGFYATPDRSNAAIYSTIRQESEGRKGEEPVVYPVLPYQARMLDLRLRENTLANAPVPEELVNEYYAFLRNKMANFKTAEVLENHNLRADYTDTQNRTAKLAALIRAHERIGLRHMMNGESEGDTVSRGSGDLANFMQSKGLDGVIYNEGGDRSDQTHTLSYVFYNLHKIGTYEAWHSEEK